MYPGPGAPYRGMRMGPGVMRQGPGPFGGAPMRSAGPTPFRMNHIMGPSQPTRQGGGGLLAKLLGKGNGVGMQNMRGPVSANGGGLLKSLTNPGAINGFLNNTQQVLKTAQQVGPMIQQYGPIVKNLPAMWKLYRGFKDLPEQEEAEEEKSSSKEKLSSANKASTYSAKKTTTSRRRARPVTTSAEQKETPSKLVKKESTPKLFY